MACVNGRFIAIECKAGNNKPTKLQQHNLDKISAAGGVALVINETNLDVLEATLEKIKLLAAE